MSYNQDLSGGIPPLSSNNPNIQTIPNSGFDQGFNSNTGGTGQMNTSNASTAYDPTQPSNLGSGGQVYNQNSSNSGMNSSGNYDTTQASGGGGWNASQQQPQYEQTAYNSNQDSSFSGDLHSSSQYQSTTHKASAGDKIKGTFEKLSGKITGNPDKVAHGEDLASGHTMP